MNNLKRPDSEAGIIATLIHHPDYYYFSEELSPNHFTKYSNKIVYAAIEIMAKQGIMRVDAFNILEALGSSEKTRAYTDDVTVDQLQELIEMSNVLARHTVEEYQICVRNVLDSAFRRDAIARLQGCIDLCLKQSEEDIQQKIYNVIDEVMTEYSYANDTPLFGEVVDLCWEEIKSRQGDGYAGIPFKFPALNEYATIVYLYVPSQEIPRRLKKLSHKLLNILRFYPCCSKAYLDFRCVQFLRLKGFLKITPLSSDMISSSLLPVSSAI